MTAQATEYVRPEWREVNIDLLAEKLYAAHTRMQWGEPFKLENAAWNTIRDWTAVAEAAVDELIDRPERAFQAQVDALLALDEHPETSVDRQWSEAKASDWLPGHS